MWRWSQVKWQLHSVGFVDVGRSTQEDDGEECECKLDEERDLGWQGAKAGFLEQMGLSLELG